VQHCVQKCSIFRLISLQRVYCFFKPTKPMPKPNTQFDVIFSKHIENFVTRTWSQQTVRQIMLSSERQPWHWRRCCTIVLSLRQSNAHACMRAHENLKILCTIYKKQISHFLFYSYRAWLLVKYKECISLANTVFDEFHNYMSQKKAGIYLYTSFAASDTQCI
jgi:hypothetical protein